MVPHSRISDSYHFHIVSHIEKANIICSDCSLHFSSFTAVDVFLPKHKCTFTFYIIVVIYLAYRMKETKLLVSLFL